MKNPIMFLLFTLVVLSACQHPGQQADKSTVLPIDSVSVVSDSSNMEIISPDTVKIDYTTLPDSAKIVVWGSLLTRRVIFSINHNNENSIEALYPSAKGTLSKEYSLEILRKIGYIFIEQKVPVITSKKKLPYCVDGDFPNVEFVIYYNGKTIRDDIWVADENGEYEYTYSGPFLELFDLLFSTAYEFSESNQL